MFEAVAERWKNQYCQKDGWKNVWMPNRKSKCSAEEIYKKLLECKTKEEVVDVMGMHNWVTLNCESCGKQVEEIISFCGESEEPYSVCKDCLSEALEIMKGSK
jgi:peptide subunit release factor 1 (eRF1)